MLVFHPQLRRPRAPPCNPPYFDAQAGVAGGGIDILAAIAQREQIAALFGITVQRALRGIQARIWRELPVAAGQGGAEGQRTEPLAAVAACMREAAICGHVATQGVVQQLVADQRIHEQAAAQAVARIQRHAVGLAIAAAATLANIAAIASIPQRGTHREGVTEPAVGTDGDTIGLEVDSAALAALVAPGADRAAHPQAQRPGPARCPPSVHSVVARTAR
ncbi:hypothetical protein G6F57_019036 [Rhizopus arrhizus]|nr:hypothetical protein G6F57_019036 [Rhizopus arrhizus]